MEAKDLLKPCINATFTGKGLEENQRGALKELLLRIAYIQTAYKGDKRECAVMAEFVRILRTVPFATGIIYEPNDWVIKNPQLVAEIIQEDPLLQKLAKRWEENLTKGKIPCLGEKGVSWREVK